MKALIVAPYARGLAHGGSQRTTSIAEGLEAQGLTVDWWEVSRSRRGTVQKLGELMRLVPGQVAVHSRRPAPPGTWDLAIAAHSYLAGHALAVPSAATWVDYSNLEWEHLLDVSRLAGGAKGVRLRGEARLLQRYERQAAQRADLVTCVGERDAAWLRRADTAPVVLPNALPRATRQAADEIRRRRAPAAEPVLAYIGTLRFPPNLLSLQQWLNTTWPVLRRRWPALRLRVAGEIPLDQRDRLEGGPGVELLGFVDDLNSILASATALVLPFYGRAGTSLRVLFAARAGVPLLGTAEGLRGFAEEGGIVATTPEAWVSGIERVLAEEAVPPTPEDSFWPAELTGDHLRSLATAPPGTQRPPD